MALVSRLYRQAPSTWAGSPDERRVRLKRALSRLKATYGAGYVEHQIRTYQPRNEDERAVQMIILAEVA